MIKYPLIESSDMIGQEEKINRWIDGRASWEECRANLLTEPWPHCQGIADQFYDCFVLDNSRGLR